MKILKISPISRSLFTAVLLFVITIPSYGDNRFHHGSHDGKSTISVMTQNVDAGTDFKYLFGIPDQFSVVQAATFTYGEVLNSDIPGRAELLAKLIARTQPDLISLQEVTLWKTISADGQSNILFDQLQLLLDALKKMKHPYKVAIKQDLTKGVLPIDPTLLGRSDDTARAVDFTDQDVIIARADLKGSEFQLLNKEKHVYNNLLSFPVGTATLTSVRGWISVDARIKGSKLRFVNTHLETVIPFISQTILLQEAQASELVNALKTVNTPVVIAGDFNADAEFANIGPDQTDTPNIMVNAGYNDTWDAKFPVNPGFTWPLFIEDPLAPNPDGPFERIDLIYERGLDILSVRRVGYLKDHFPSDHLGVLAKFETQNKH